jgi:hypothetical protein
MSIRISNIVTDCINCPFYAYDSGGAYRCAKVDERVLEPEKVAEFCPLPHYPSREISQLQYTLQMHQKSEKDINLSVVVLRHLSAVFQTPVSNFAALVLKVKPSRDWPEEIVINRDYITSIDLRNEEIIFTYRERKYKVYGTREGWKLQGAVALEGKEYWGDIQLATGK